MVKEDWLVQSMKTTPMLMTVEQMSKISGLGENRLRKLLEDGEIEYIQNGNRRLIAEHAIWDWYCRARVPVRLNNNV